jgi:predicted metal-binding membrane protein
MNIRSFDILRALFVLFGAIAQVAMGALPFIQGWEQTVASRSAEVETLLTPAGYAFSIWSVLFVGCGLYALIHFARLTSPLMRQTGWLAGAVVLTAWVKNYRA